MLFLLLSVTSAWTAPLPSAPVATLPLVQYAPPSRPETPGFPFTSRPVDVLAAPAGGRPALAAQGSVPSGSSNGALTALCALGALVGYGVRRNQAACPVGGYRTPRNEYDTYGMGRFDYDMDNYERSGRYGGRNGGRRGQYADEYDRHGSRYGGPRYGAVNRQGYGAIGAMPGSWARNAQERAQYRRHERFSHPAYEASRVRRMGINAPAGYSATIRDAQYRRFQRDREYELYGDEFDDYDFEGPFDFEGPYRERLDYDDERVYGRFGPREYDRELVD